jgi:hypothetical protein
MISVRENEWHHFENCRSHIFSILNENRNEGRDIDDIFRSEILPEMIKIERIIERVKAKANKSFLQGAIHATISIASTVLTSGMHALIPAATAAIGAGCVAKELVPSIGEKIGIPDEIKDSKMYYAWKISQNAP